MEARDKNGLVTTQFFMVTVRGAAALPAATPAPVAAPSSAVSGNLTRLHRSKSISVSLGVRGTEVSTCSYNDRHDVNKESGFGMGGSAPITWSGATFSGTATAINRWTYSFTGTVSADGSRIVSLTFTKEDRGSAPAAIMVSKVQLGNMPLDWRGQGVDASANVEFSAQGTDAGAYGAAAQEVHTRNMNNGEICTRTTTATRADQESKLLVQFIFTR